MAPGCRITPESLANPAKQLAYASHVATLWRSLTRDNVLVDDRWFERMTTPSVELDIVASEPYHCRH